MGTPVPPTFPDFKDGKWYYCIIDTFFQNIPPSYDTCEDPYRRTVETCIEGSVIEAWLPHQCDLFFPLFLPAVGAQRLTACHGPYDTALACAEAHAG